MLLELEVACRPPTRVEPNPVVPSVPVEQVGRTPPRIAEEVGFVGTHLKLNRNVVDRRLKDTERLTILNASKDHRPEFGEILGLFDPLVPKLLNLVRRGKLRLRRLFWNNLESNAGSQDHRDIGLKHPLKPSVVLHLHSSAIASQPAKLRACHCVGTSTTGLGPVGVVVFTLQIVKSRRSLDLDDLARHEVGCQTTQ